MLSLYYRVYFYNHSIYDFFLSSEDLLAHSVYTYAVVKIALRPLPPDLLHRQISLMMPRVPFQIAISAYQSLLHQIYDQYSPNLLRAAIHYGESVSQSWIHE